MRIGEFAIFAETSASTVRYYEQIGLLPAPSVSGTISGRYGEADAALGLGSSCAAAR